MPGEDRRDLPSNNPYRNVDPRWVEVSAESVPSWAQQLLNERAQLHWGAAGQPLPDPVQPDPTGQQPTLPAYQTTAPTGHEASPAWVAAVNRAGQEQLDLERGGAGDLNPWDQQTNPALIAAAANGVWEPPSAPAQFPADPQSDTADQLPGHGDTGDLWQGFAGPQESQFHGYVGGTLFDPVQAAHAAQQMGQSFSSPQWDQFPPDQADPLAMDQTSQVYDWALGQAQAISAAEFPGNDFPPSGIENPVAGAANDSLSYLPADPARAARSTNATGLNRNPAVRGQNRGQRRRPQERRAR